MIGIRDIDNDEYISLQKHRIKVYTMDHITKYGIG
jgi:arginase family enzyme